MLPTCTPAEALSMLNGAAPQRHRGDAPRETAHNPSWEGGRRIAYLLSRYPAVSHSFLLNEVLQLRKRGFDIEVASINLPDRRAQDLAPVERAESERVFYVKSVPYVAVLALVLLTLMRRPAVFARGLLCAIRLGGWDLHELVFCLCYFVEALLVGSWMRKRGHTHLHIHFGTAVATVGLITSAAWGVPYSLSIHGPDEFSDTDDNHLKQKIEGAKFAICISDFCRSQLMRVTGPEHWNKLEVVRLGVDSTVFAPRSDREESGGVMQIVCVGRLIPAKGQLLLVRAVADLVAQGYALRLRLVGDGENRVRIEDYVRGHNLGHVVRLEGALNHEQTREVLASADLFVLASFAEGLPVALMEAMAMEIPCISTYVAGIPELIRDGIDGLLVPASSQAVLVSAMRSLLDSRQLRRELGTAGRRRTLACHCLTRNCDVLEDVLRRKLPAVV